MTENGKPIIEKVRATAGKKLRENTKSLCGIIQLKALHQNNLYDLKFCVFLLFL